MFCSVVLTGHAGSGLDAVWKPGHSKYDAAAKVVAAKLRDKAKDDFMACMRSIGELKKDKEQETGAAANQIGKRINKLHT